VKHYKLDKSDKTTQRRRLHTITRTIRPGNSGHEDTRSNNRDKITPLHKITREAVRQNKCEGGIGLRRSPIDIPISDRYCMTVEEAAAYSLIGENRLREIINNDRYADFLLWVGNTVRIKRPLFEEYLAKLNFV